MDSIYLLDHAFAPLCLPIDGYFSLVWSLSYQTCGTFAALLPYDGAGIWEEAVYLTDGVRCGRIERIEIENGRVRLTGRTLECLLYDRLFAEKFEYTGTLSEACLTAVRTCCADLPLTIETDGASFPQTGIYRAQWTTVGQFLHETLSQAGGSFAVEYVPGAPKCAFRLLCGTDRSAAGAIFSEDFGNIASLMVERDRSDRVDRVYVTGADRVTVSVVREGAEAPYRDARIEAADMESADYEVFADYTDALRDRGRAYLAAYGGEIVRVDGGAEPDTLPAYGVDYALGDLCTVRTAAYSGTVRLTAIDMVSENGVRRVYPYFGIRRRTLRDALGER